MKETLLNINTRDEYLPHLEAHIQKKTTAVLTPSNPPGSTVQEVAEIGCANGCDSSIDVLNRFEVEARTQPESEGSCSWRLWTGLSRGSAPESGSLDLRKREVVWMVQLCFSTENFRSQIATQTALKNLSKFKYPPRGTSKYWTRFSGNEIQHHDIRTLDSSAGSAQGANHLRAFPPGALSSQCRRIITDSSV